MGIIPGIFGKKSFLDNSPLKNYLETQFKALGGEAKRMFTVGMVNAQNGEYIVKSEKVGKAQMPGIVFSSASVPGFFPHIYEGDRIIIDGGTTDNMNLRAAISRCRDIVAENDTQITIDVLMTNPRT